MKFVGTITTVVAMLVVAGMAFAVLVDHGTASAAAHEMAGEMPCCPDHAPMPPDCATSCALAAACPTGGFSGATLTAVTWRSPAGQDWLVMPMGATRHAGLAPLPPQRPPRA